MYGLAAGACAHIRPLCDPSLHIAELLCPKTQKVDWCDSTRQQMQVPNPEKRVLVIL